jgi:8-amino-7-oxononanoate synthase
MRPHAHHFVYSLPPEGAQATLGAARREAEMSPHAHHFVYSLPPEGAQATLGAARREA